MMIRIMIIGRGEDRSLSESILLLKTIEHYNQFHNFRLCRFWVAAKGLSRDKFDFSSTTFRSLKEIASSKAPPKVVTAVTHTGVQLQQ